MSRTSSTIVSMLQIVCLMAAFGVLFVASGYFAVRWALSSEQFDVPEVIGLPIEQAEQLLAREGLEVDLNESPLADATVPRGHVLRQNPPAGTPIKRQPIVRLTLSAGRAERLVPDTTGDVFRRAQIFLQQQEVGVDYTAWVHSYDVPEDRVIAQQPSAAELGPETTAPARLLVSLGTPPRIFVMPDLYGRRLDVVQAFLEASGFRVAPVQRRRSRGVPPGRVIHQEPAPGYQVAEGAVIRLQVSSS